MTLPDPIIDFAEWGEIKGRRLDFSIKEDRIEACKWYIDLLDQQWKLQNYDQLDFEGFYWVAETQSTTAEILPEIAMYIKSKGYKFYWIPYMYAEGAAKWREAGFDVAYQQPNYFFDLDKPKSLFTEAIFNSKNYNMGLEMEFDERITEEAFLKRFYDYIEAFNGANAWTNTPIAYYEGGKAWLEMSKYPQGTDVKKAYDDLADIIIMRQKHEDTKL